MSKQPNYQNQNRGRNNNRDQTRVNERIRAPKVRVVGQDGQQLGVLATRDAIAKALSLGLDLVEIAAQADPPVCKIIDYGKYKYEQAKLKKVKSKTATKMKEIKLRVGTGQHDYNIKMGHIENFLSTGHKVRIVLQFRGREMAHRDLGFVVLKKVAEDLKTMANVDAPPRMGGKVITMIITPLPLAQQKRKFQLYHGELLEPDQDDDDDFDEDPHEAEEASDTNDEPTMQE